MRHFGDYIHRVLKFLSTPIDLDSLRTVMDVEDNGRAIKKAMDEILLSAKNTRGKMTRSELQKCYTVLDISYLDVWVSSYVTHVSNQGNLEYWGSNDVDEKVIYTAGLKGYWKEVRQHCHKEARKVAPNDDSNNAKLVRNMENKLDWIEAGLLCRLGSPLALLPLPCKYLLPGLLKLYKNEKYPVEDIITEVGPIHQCSSSSTHT